ncbi:NAD(P)-dependent oxidoreductase [Corynebacterium callunae]|uniref:NAD(P)-dependent oxidoreductase n=1 Tax=Corynebacterium callunae TaxID=1721 RepID=UPI001FFE6C09|nr:NAD(P)H-binding protein [Corynebacterium callunae]MCK2201138.1 NAD(P)H-binding protein [Corynebacterium callunae]
MKIGIIGATGTSGQAIYAEAHKRGHEVVAVVRDGAKARDLFGEDAVIIEKDALELASTDLAGLEVVVNAFSTSPDTAEKHIELSRNLVAAAGANTRLVFILGAGSLTNPETGRPFVEVLRELPDAAAWINIPEQQFKQLEYLRTVDDVQWVGVSPQAQYPAEGPATTPQLGTDSLLLAADGQSHTTAGTMAIAIVDEIENPQHRNTRFTVSDA